MRLILNGGNFIENLLLGVLIPVFVSFFTVFLPRIFNKTLVFIRKDFFSRDLHEKIEALKWIETTNCQLGHPLEMVDQKMRLISYGLHPNRDLSIKILYFYSLCEGYEVSSLKTLLRFQGLYRVKDGDVIPRKYSVLIATLIFIFLVLFSYIPVFLDYQHKGFVVSVIISLSINIVSSMLWTWVVASVITVRKISKRINKFRYNDY